MEINRLKCTQCGLCEEICIRKNIKIVDFLIGDYCFHCYHCMAICPKGAITDNGEISKPMQNFNIKPIDFENLILNKRSNRMFSKKEVSKKDLQKIAEFLRFSPTGTNTQKLHMTVIGSKNKVQELSKLAIKSFIFKKRLLFIFLPLIIMLFGFKRSFRILKLGKFLEQYKNGEDILTYNAPGIFIFHCPKTASTPEQDGVIASTIATLYAETLGFATCFNGILVQGINLSPKIKRHLDIPRKHKVYSTFLLGYPKYKFSRTVLRKKANYNIIS